MCLWQCRSASARDGTRVKSRPPNTAKGPIALCHVRRSISSSETRRLWRINPIAALRNKRARAGGPATQTTAGWQQTCSSHGIERQTCPPLAFSFISTLSVRVLSLLFVSRLQQVASEGERERKRERESEPSTRRLLRQQSVIFIHSFILDNYSFTQSACSSLSTYLALSLFWLAFEFFSCGVVVACFSRQPKPKRRYSAPWNRSVNKKHLHHRNHHPNRFTGTSLPPACTAPPPRAPRSPLPFLHRRNWN